MWPSSCSTGDSVCIYQCAWGPTPTRSRAATSRRAQAAGAADTAPGLGPCRPLISADRLSSPELDPSSDWSRAPSPNSELPNYRAPSPELQRPPPPAALRLDDIEDAVHHAPVRGERAEIWIAARIPPARGTGTSPSGPARRAWSRRAPAGCPARTAAPARTATATACRRPRRGRRVSRRRRARSCAASRRGSCRRSRRVVPARR